MRACNAMAADVLVLCSSSSLPVCSLPVPVRINGTKDTRIRMTSAIPMPYRPVSGCSRKMLQPDWAGLAPQCKSRANPARHFTSKPTVPYH